MTHKFNIKNKHKLDNEKRREMLPPYKILSELELKEGDVVADIGCGIGYFTFPASEIVGESGKVFALDVSSEMLEEIDRKVGQNAVANVVSTLTEENNLKLPEETVTFAFISHVLHETENKEKFLNEVKKIIADNGRIAIIEWQKVESDFGPPLDHRLDGEYVQKLLEDIGFKGVNIKNIGEYFYVVTGEKLKSY